MDALSVLRRLGTGRLLEDLADSLAVTAAEVVETGKPGVVTLTLKVSNKSQGDPLVVVDEVVSRRSPKLDPRGAFFFAVEGGLYKEDPRQVRMEFREVDAGTGEIREAGGDEREERTVND